MEGETVASRGVAGGSRKSGGRKILTAKNAENAKKTSQR